MAKVTPKKFLEKYLLIVALLFFVVIMIRTAWIAEDAYITFRTMDNFVNGYGLRWNVAERVQSFTHPLWLMVISPFYYLFRSEYFVPLIISMLLSSVVVYSVATRYSKSIYIGLSAVLILAFSKSFTDYSTSGLENPLTHLLLVLFTFNYFKNDFSAKQIRLLSCISALGMLNRLDTALFYLPGLLFFVYLGWKKNGFSKSFIPAAVGALPIIVWEIFSLLYYGFLFPNTAYAKLSTGVPKWELMQQGITYFINSISIDPITLTVIGLATAAVFCFRKKEFYPITIGVVLYMLYTIKVGGDFMSGRFLAAPLLVSVIVLVKMIPKVSVQYAPALAVLLILGLVTPSSPLYADRDYSVGYSPFCELNLPKDGIADERAYYFSGTGLLNYYGRGEWPDFKAAIDGKRIRKEIPGAILTGGAIGMYGFFVGPDVTFIDYYGLSDPMLARMPAIQEDPLWGAISGIDTWRIGHFRRHIPEGYVEVMKEGGDSSHFASSHIQEYYDHMSLITRGSLFSPDRLKTILAMNMGEYDHLIEDLPESAFVDPNEVLRNNLYFHADGTKKTDEEILSVLESDEVRAKCLEVGIYR